MLANVTSPANVDELLATQLESVWHLIFSDKLTLAQKWSRV